MLEFLAEIVGTSLPPDAAEDSFSLLPLLRGEPPPSDAEALTTDSLQAAFVNAIPDTISGFSRRPLPFWTPT